MGIAEKRFLPYRLAAYRERLCCWQQTTAWPLTFRDFNRLLAPSPTTSPPHELHEYSARLQQARLTLLLDFPFFGQLALRLLPVLDHSVESAQTDGREIRFNPDFCAKLTDPQLAWLYAHEVAHPALGHLWRIGSRDVDKVNRAADYVVNEMLDAVITGQPGAAHRMRTHPRRAPGPPILRPRHGANL